MLLTRVEHIFAVHKYAQVRNTAYMNEHKYYCGRKYRLLLRYFVVAFSVKVGLAPIILGSGNVGIPPKTGDLNKKARNDRRNKRQRKFSFAFFYFTAAKFAP